jgi:hypothetical protein
VNESVSAYIAFDGNQRIAHGPLSAVALKVKETSDAHPLARLLVFHAATSELIDFDCRGTPAQMLHRLNASAKESSLPADPTPDRTSPVGPGRPKLGVVAREVTLLPRHWEWLSSQPGGASVALRKLVEHARRASASSDGIRQAQAAAYRFMSAMAGNLDGFEEAARALFATDRTKFDALLAPWPADVQEHLKHLAEPAFQITVNGAIQDTQAADG